VTDDPSKEGGRESTRGGNDGLTVTKPGIGTRNKGVGRKKGKRRMGKLGRHLKSTLGGESAVAEYHDAIGRSRGER